MYGALVGSPPNTAGGHMRSQLSSRGTAANNGGYRMSKQERLREREVNFENSILLSKMLDIIKRKRGSANLIPGQTKHIHTETSAIVGSNS
jgi:hypothetical protein